MKFQILFMIAIQAMYVFGGTKSIFDVCLMKPDPGFCKAYFPRFYYDAAEGRCKKFIYGGCLGNKNNFETVEECELACSSHDPCADLSCKFGSRCQVENGKAKCQCSNICTLEYVPVCGYDGTEYSNLCALKVAECETQRQIKYDNGPCRWH